MDKSQLEQLQQVATTKFNELQKEAEEYRQKIQDIEDELKRLQGEYRSYQSMLDALPKEEPKTVEATTKGAKNGK